MTSPGTSPGSDLGTGPRVRDPLPRWRRVFPGRDDQVREVRRWLTAVLPGVPERDDAVVVAVELVTNAIRHTASGRGGLIMVEVTWCGPVLRIAVADDGAPGGPRLAAAPGGPAAARGGLAESGRGLHLVRALAASTGVCGDRRGRLVWADIAWAGPRPAAPQLPPLPRAGRHRPVPVQLRREAGDEAGHGHPECSLAAVPASRAAGVPASQAAAAGA
jgi:anti-sigma regulatory factor (Ser/Thr protein kinase)